MRETLQATLERSTSNTGSGKPSSGNSGMARTAWLYALAIFLVINIFLWKVAGEEKAAAKDLWSGSGSIDLAVGGFQALHKRPTVVLLGSSLIMFPFYAMDAERDKSQGDIFHHHGSTVLTGELQRAGMKDASVYSLAIFGQMASDAFIYVDEYLKGAKKPDWLVLGVAPRDFSDHDLPNPTATFTFKRLVGLTNFPRYADLYLPGWQEKGEFLFSHLCYFYSKRWRLQQEFDKAVNRVYKGSSVPAAAGETRTKSASAGFMLTGTAEQRWSNSLIEYKRRYRDIGQKDLSIQMGFLDRLLTVCRQRGIKVVLVNMPLTPSNRALLPPGFYSRFSSSLAALAGSRQARLLDLGSSSEFVSDDYWDSTHLNHHGGHKLVHHLLSALTQK